MYQAATRSTSSWPSWPSWPSWRANYGLPAGGEPCNPPPPLLGCCAADLAGRLRVACRQRVPQATLVNQTRLTCKHQCPPPALHGGMGAQARRALTGGCVWRIKHGHLSATQQAPLQSAGRTRRGTAPVRACVVRWHATNAAAGRTRADHVAVGHLHSHDLLRDLWQLITVLSRSTSRSGWEFTVADRHEPRWSGRRRLRCREAGRAPRPRLSPTPTGFQLGDPRFSGSADPYTRHSRRLKSRAGEGRRPSPPSSLCRRRRRPLRRQPSPPGAPAPAPGAAGGRVC